jgi:hypothetical protein
MVFSVMSKNAKKPKRQKLIKMLDAEFSYYIRLRDSDSHGIVTCPLCWKKIPVKFAQNMHFISRWVLKYRFDENNCYAGCMRCNVILNGNYIEYTFFMIKKFWKEKVEAMKNDKEAFELKTREIEEKLNYYKELNQKLEKKKHFKY